MKRRNLIALLVVIVLGSLSFWFIRNQGNSTIRKELSDFAVQDTASLTKIFLGDKSGNKVILTRVASGWMVNDKYVARPDAIRYLLQTMHDLTVQSPVAKKARENVVKRLSTGSTKVEAYVGDKLIKKYYVGDETMDATGTYMLLADPETGENSSEPFVMEIKGFTGYLNTRYFTRVDEWRDRTAFRYYAPRIRSIVFEQRKQPELGFTVSQGADGKTFSLVDHSGKPHAFDTLAVKQYISYFGNVGVERIVSEMPQTKKDSLLRSGASASLAVTDDQGKVRKLQFYTKYGDVDPNLVDTTGRTMKGIPLDPDRMYALIDGTDWVLVQYYVFGKLMPTPDYFLPKRK